MAHPNLTPDLTPGLNFVPLEAARAFADGQEFQALTLLRRAQVAYSDQSVAWAQLERLIGLVLIHVQREVEGTFCLERADARLDALNAFKPDLFHLAARAEPGTLE
ncbi:hypothetical protein [Deinococcus cavernae]|uniref:hypothetical protein n=1 Tax=Deinococcus cavernae TaxID=2320857 RepID=UPI001F1A4975|nr:hypothetical protein [Deinococcus cavernae]